MRRTLSRCAKDVQNYSRHLREGHVVELAASASRPPRDSPVLSPKLADGHDANPTAEPLNGVSMIMASQQENVGAICVKLSFSRQRQEIRPKSFGWKRTRADGNFRRATFLEI